jgi:hypothetical protein
MTAAELANKVEKQIKLHDWLGANFHLVLDPDAARALVDLLREVERLKTDRAELAKRISFGALWRVWLIWVLLPAIVVFGLFPGTSLQQLWSVSVPGALFICVAWIVRGDHP